MDSRDNNEAQSALESLVKKLQTKHGLSSKDTSEMDREKYKKLADTNNPLAYAVHALLTDDISKLDKTRVAEAHQALCEKYRSNNPISRSLEVISTYLSKGKDGLKQLEYLHVDEKALGRADGNFAHYMKSRPAPACYINLSGADLRDMNFKLMELRGANFQGAKLNGAFFKYSCVVDTNFEAASLDQVTFNECYLLQDNFKNAKLSDTIFVGEWDAMTQVTSCNFDSSDLSSARFSNTDFTQNSFTNADMTGIYTANSIWFNDCNFTNASMFGANITTMTHEGSVIRDSSDLSFTNLAFAELQSNVVIKADLSSANCYMTRSYDEKPIKKERAFEFPPNMTPSMLDHILSYCEQNKNHATPKELETMKNALFQALDKLLSDKSPLDLKTKHALCAIAATSKLFKPAIPVAGDNPESTKSSKKGLFSKKSQHEQLAARLSTLSELSMAAEMSKPAAIQKN